MKSKYLIGTLLCLTLLLPIIPVLGAWHPPEEACPYFAVIIEDELTGDADPPALGPWRFNFEEPEYGYCTNFTVEVWIINVEDLYGYEFKLSWDTTYFTLVEWVIEETWEDQFPIRPLATYKGTSPYQQAVVAKAPSPGVTGDFKLATLTFHILNDVCWPQVEVLGKFDLCLVEARDSCTAKIDLCDEKDGYYRYIPMQPVIYIDPKLEENCVIGETFTATVHVANITKMRSLHYRLVWYSKSWPWLGWRRLLDTSETSIVINEDVLPEAKRAVDTLVLKEGVWLNTTHQGSYIEVHVEMKPTFPLINGTFWFMKITFKKLDPWYCGGQPQYDVDSVTHEMLTQNATTPIEFEWGYFDVECPDLDYITFGDCMICKDYGPASAPSCPSYDYEWRVNIGWGASYWDPVHKASGRIQWAIDAIETAGTGGLIYVYPGTYNEALDIKKDDLYLIGNGSATTIIAPATGKPIEIWGNVAKVKNVTIQGFTLKPPTPDYGLIALSNTVPSMEYDTEDLRICDVIIDSAGGRGLGLFDVKNVALTGVTVQKCNQTGEGAVEIVGGYNVNFTHCAIKDNERGLHVFWVAGYAANGKIKIDDSDLSGNDEYALKNEASITVDARKNWWGSRLDPSGMISGNVLYIPWISCCLASYADATYIFDPVPGDLDGNGVVELVDLMIIASLYCNNFPKVKTGDPTWYADPNFWLYYYNLVKETPPHIGLEDIIVVAKNFGRTCEPHVIPA